MKTFTALRTINARDAGLDRPGVTAAAITEVVAEVVAEVLASAQPISLITEVKLVVTTRVMIDPWRLQAKAVLSS